MRTLNRLLSIASVGIVFLAASSGVRAQSPPPPPPGQNFERVGPGPFMPDDVIGFVGFEGRMGGKTVTGAPFSASVSTQETQVLADGNQIQRTATGTVARDSQGRTRNDMTLPAIGPWASSGQTAPHFININDPVAGAQYILESDRKIARKMQPRHMGKRGQGASPNGTAAPSPGNDKNVITTSLGTQTIGGVQAQGTRYTRTIPAGVIGNEKPIVITVDRWYSPDLQTVVMTKRSDPRRGDTTFQLTEIQRQEPDASLFQVPADYTVKAGGPGGRHARHMHGPPPPDGGTGAPPPPQD
jgi:hypothetical protein